MFRSTLRDHWSFLVFLPIAFVLGWTTGDTDPKPQPQTKAVQIPITPPARPNPQFEAQELTDGGLRYFQLANCLRIPLPTDERHEWISTSPDNWRVDVYRTDIYAPALYYSIRVQRFDLSKLTNADPKTILTNAVDATYAEARDDVDCKLGVYGGYVTSHDGLPAWHGFFMEKGNDRYVRAVYVLDGDRLYTIFLGGSRTHAYSPIADKTLWAFRVLRPAV